MICFNDSLSDILFTINLAQDDKLSAEIPDLTDPHLLLRMQCHY